MKPRETTYNKFENWSGGGYFLIFFENFDKSSKFEVPGPDFLLQITIKRMPKSYKPSLRDEKFFGTQDKISVGGGVSFSKKVTKSQLQIVTKFF